MFLFVIVVFVPFLPGANVFFSLMACGFFSHLISRVQKSKVHQRRRKKHFHRVKLNRCEKNRLNRKRSRFRFFRYFEWNNCFFPSFLCSRVGKQYEQISLAHAQQKNQFDSRVQKFGGHVECGAREKGKKTLSKVQGKKKLLNEKNSIWIAVLCVNFY